MGGPKSTLGAESVAGMGAVVGVRLDTVHGRPTTPSRSVLRADGREARSLWGGSSIG